MAQLYTSAIDCGTSPLKGYVASTFQKRCNLHYRKRDGCCLILIGFEKFSGLVDLSYHLLIKS